MRKKAFLAIASLAAMAVAGMGTATKASAAGLPPNCPAPILAIGSSVIVADGTTPPGTIAVCEDVITETDVVVQFRIAPSPAGVSLIVYSLVSEGVGFNVNTATVPPLIITVCAGPPPPNWTCFPLTVI